MQCSNIPKSVLTRVKRNSSKEEDYIIAAEEYTRYLKNRNYSQEVIDKALVSLKSMTRETLLNHTAKQKVYKRVFP